MSYSIHQISSDFRIIARKTEAALVALKQLAGSETCGCAGKKHFMWINDSSAFLSASSLDEALLAWRWRATQDDEGGIADLDFVGDSLGDEDLLFRTLAPFVQESSLIVVVGEDAAIWRWYFSHGAVCRQAGRLTFEGSFDGDVKRPPF